MVKLKMMVMVMVMAILPSVVYNINRKHGSDAHPMQKPHILLIVADDLGWNDVSWHNPNVLTPNLQKLAEEGVILNRSYVLPICTPTRSALMTGRYPFTIGRQRSTIRPSEPVGLTLNATLLPEALKNVGYSTHVVGKWHLGFCSWSYTPTYRGFDTFYGYYTGAEDYYTHMRSNLRDPREDDGHTQEQERDRQEEQMTSPPSSENGDGRMWLDLRNNTQPDPDKEGIYSSHLFPSYVENLLESRNPKDPMFLYFPFQSVHAPLMVPQNYTKHYKHIHDQDRRTYLGMVTALDEAVGRVVDALKRTGHYNNSVIVFTTDNGGTINHGGNNWPLRGMKTTLWEGGTRGVAFVHSPLLPNPGTVSNKLLHAIDWFRTLVGLAGGDVPDGVDGFDQWNAITGNRHSPRTKMVYNIDKTQSLRASVRIGNYKLIVGFPGEGDWTPPPELSISQEEREAIDQEKGKMFYSDEPLLIPDNEKLNWTLPRGSAQYHTTVYLSDMDFLRIKDESSYFHRVKRALKKETHINPPTLLPKLSSTYSLFNPLIPQSPLDNRRTNPLDNPLSSKTNQEIKKDIKLDIRQHLRSDTTSTLSSDIKQTINPELTTESKKESSGFHRGNLGRFSKASYYETPPLNSLSSNINRGIVEDAVTWETIRYNKDMVNIAWEKQYSINLLSLIKNETEFRLYNVKEDPEERNNLAERRLHKVKVLLEYLLEEIVNRYVRADIKDEIPSANPKYWNNVWSPGWCEAT